MANEKSWWDNVKDSTQKFVNPDAATFHQEGSMRIQNSETPFDKARKNREALKAAQESETYKRWHSGD
jgi:hypothetical protein